jgi:hypothetical protein
MGIGQAIAVTKQVEAGLGKREATLDASEIERFQKVRSACLYSLRAGIFQQVFLFFFMLTVAQAAYASEILYIVMLFFNKIATLFFVATLARTPLNYRVVLGVIVFTCLWATTAIFGIAFQCELPQAWAILSKKCFDQVNLALVFHRRN